MSVDPTPNPDEPMYVLPQHTGVTVTALTDVLGDGLARHIAPGLPTDKHLPRWAIHYMLIEQSGTYRPSPTAGELERATTALIEAALAERCFQLPDRTTISQLIREHLGEAMAAQPRGLAGLLAGSFIAARTVHGLVRAELQYHQDHGTPDLPEPERLEAFVTALLQHSDPEW